MPWVRRLIDGNGGAGPREGRWTHALLHDLPTAFHPHLSPEVLSDLIEEALSASPDGYSCQHAAVRSRPASTAHVWAVGELWRAPSDEDRRRLRDELQPKLFEQTIAAFASERDELTNEGLREVLVQAGLHDPEKQLSNAENVRLAATLEGLGWEYKIVGEGATTPEGPGRRRCWRRPVESSPEAAA